VGVAERVDEFAGLEAGDLCDHHGEQGVGGDVEGDTEEDVGAALIKLAGEFAVGDVELKEGVTGRQGHLVDNAGVIGNDEEAAAVWIIFDLGDEVGDLVDCLTVGGLPAAPLCAVDGAEISVFIGPFIPDFYAVFLQIFDICVTGEEPEELVNDGAEVAFFGGDEGEALCEVEAHLAAKDAEGSGSGAVFFFGAVFEDVTHKVEIMFHDS